MSAQVLSMHSAYPPDFVSQQEQRMSYQAGMSAMDMQLSGTATPEDQRGRRRTRESEDGDEDMDQGSGGGGAGSSKKRRRSRKGMDKKFECPHEGCGKSYSRAEHLYRHQLNHNPKQIYRCDFPDCQRSFVRQDLCARHKERHTTRGSQLLRKDNFMQNPNPIVTAALTSQSAMRMQGSTTSPPAVRSNPSYHGQSQQHGSDGPYQRQSPMSAMNNSSMSRSDASPPLDPSLQSPVSDFQAPSSLNRTTSHDSGYRPTDGRQAQSYGALGRQSSFGPGLTRSGTDPGFGRPNTVAQNMQSLSISGSGYNEGGSQSQPYARAQQQQSHYPNSTSSQFQSLHNFPLLSTLPPPSYPATAPTSDPNSSAGYGSSNATNQMQTDSEIAMTQASEAQILENMTPQYAVPMFGGEGISRSPFAMADDFAAWLFNDQNFGSGASPMAYSSNVSNVMASQQPLAMQAPYFNFDPQAAGGVQQPMPPTSHLMAVNSILEPNLPEAALSEERRLHLIDMIEMKFNDTSLLTSMKRADIVEGARHLDHHMLSSRMMQSYTASYWVHFHAQMPILHRPTFSANHCSDLLLVAVMAIGASCLEKVHGSQTIQQCFELANFLACNIRWEIFQHPDFRPPAKLWVFQTLILLETFEKMYSVRSLHERAHIHHATTLTLMRRGSSLIGRSSTDSPPSVKGEHRGSGAGVNGGKSGATTPDDWWNQWITNEATRRAAFAAFMLDSIHATMFGHSAVMVAHEMRLPLPCDESLWSATSSSEVGRAEQLNHQNGIKQPTFLDGLKKTLTGQPVRTNAFGRTIIMAGLLSVSWHMNQRDLQVSSLGAAQALGGRDKWRGSLTRAFDFWKIDFDENLKANAAGALSSSSSRATSQLSSRSHPDLDPENVFEGRTVLHHLAHMAMHVDIVDCQIFAGAHRLLGRNITAQDAASSQRRMREVWAPTARARDATFYALRFLSQVLLPDEGSAAAAAADQQRQSDAGSTTSSSGGGGANSLAQHGLGYSARDDFLLNRPWVLYFAALIVWSYGFALDGALSPVYTLSSDAERVRDAQLFLRRVGGVRTPDDLARQQHRNACLGLLLLLRDMFARTRWELLHEASLRLQGCVDMLTGARARDGGEQQLLLQPGGLAH